LRAALLPQGRLFFPAVLSTIGGFGCVEARVRQLGVYHRLSSIDNFALFEEEKGDANLFGLTAPIEILSQVQKKADVRQAQNIRSKG
jgi:hypothetical protein